MIGRREARKAPDLAETVAGYAREKSAENVVILDMSRVSGICDSFVICSASSAVRAKTIAEHLERRMREDGRRLLHREGIRDGKWILLDFGDVVVHIFLDAIRQYYNLENLWGDAPRRLFTGA
jgi:ribosome-associated protein